MTAPLAPPTRLRPAALSAALALALAAWAYWPTLAEMAARWAHDPQYSHGYLVPVFAVYLLWRRRQRLVREDLRPAAWGLGFLIAAMALWVVGGAYFHYAYLAHISVLPCLAGIVTLAGGRAALAWAWPAIAFLAFMVPLPHSWSLAMSAPMQTVATLSSTFLLQVLGRPAIAEGNVIQLNEIELGIVEACSGLRMLVVFFALSTAMALLIRKPLWERCLIAASAIPIAMASNILRIAITGLCYEMMGDAWGHRCHDLAGLVMPLIGMVFLGIEMLILKNLLIEPTDHRVAANRGATRRVEVNPVALYRGDQSARRERRTVTPPAAPAEPVVDGTAQAPPEPAPESVARS
jgi:exosortase